MPVQIDMDMPDNCSVCRYKKTIGYGVDQRIFCKLTEIEFNSWDYRIKRFEICPLKEVKE